MKKIIVISIERECTSVREASTGKLYHSLSVHGRSRYTFRPCAEIHSVHSNFLTVPAMTRYAFWILMLAATLPGPGSYSQITEQEYGITRIGEKCVRDRNCIQHAFCRAQTTCICDPYYSPSFDRSACIATAGLRCDKDSVCATMENGECRQGVCACKETFNLDIRNSSNCIGPPQLIGDRCQRNDECQDAFDRALCINERCQCFTSYQFVNQTRKCIQRKAMYNSCEFDYECHYTDEYPDALECRKGVCLCKEGDPGCNKGPMTAAVALHVAILLLLLKLM